MKTLPSALATHVAAGTTTLAHLLKIVRTDGEIYAFTSANEDVTISSVLYVSSPGLSVSSVEISAGLAVDNLELSTLDDGTTFTLADVLGGLWRNAAFTLSKYNFVTPADGVDVLLVGTVGDVRMQRGLITAELRGLQQYLQQPVGNVTSKTCRARLGDTLCALDLGPYTASGTVGAVTSNQLFDSAFGGTPGDADYASRSLICHFSSTLADTSATPTTLTAFGGAAIIGTDGYISTSCLDGDGAGDYVTFPTASKFDFGTGKLTIEFWFKNTGSNVASDRVIQSRNGDLYSGISLSYASASTLQLLTSNDGSTWTTGTGLTFAISTTLWQFIRIRRSAAGVFTVEKDGVSMGTFTNSGSLYYNSGDAWCILGQGSGRQSQARMEQLRITKGVEETGAVPTIAWYDGPGTSGLYADDFFAEGSVTWLTGNNTGMSQKVKSYTSGGDFGLMRPMILPVQVGDTFEAIAGCRKRLDEDCATKFDNVLNFQGEPHLPGIDVLTSPPA